MAEKSAIVFGGSGFIGTHLLRDLKEKGYETLVSADIRNAAHPIDGVHYILCDVRQPIDIHEKFDEVCEKLSDAGINWSDLTVMTEA